VLWVPILETVLGNDAILHFRTYRNLLLLSDKVALGVEEKLMDVCNSMNSNRLKELEAIAVSYALVQ